MFKEQDGGHGWIEIRIWCNSPDVSALGKLSNLCQHGKKKGDEWGRKGASWSEEEDEERAVAEKEGEASEKEGEEEVQEKEKAEEEEEKEGGWRQALMQSIKIEEKTVKYQ